jgi:hypothetical protein
MGTFPLQVNPSLDPSCAVIDCSEQANPLNKIEARLDIFGSPIVRVCFCESHYHLFASTTDEHEIIPDIATEEQA